MIAYISIVEEEGEEEVEKEEKRKQMAPWGLINDLSWFLCTSFLGHSDGEGGGGGDHEKQGEQILGGGGDLSVENI